jgi:hypothetical protein
MTKLLGIALAWGFGALMLGALMRDPVEAVWGKEVGSEAVLLGLET